MSEPKTGMHHPRVAPMEGRGGITVVDEGITVKRVFKILQETSNRRRLNFTLLSTQKKQK